MKFSLDIRCDNAAFDDAPGAEIAKLLRDVAERFDGVRNLPEQSALLRDANGNRVGAWKLSK